MIDLISKQALKDKFINEAWTDYSKDAILRMIDKQPTVNEWTPVSNRLPTEEECAKQGSNLFEVTMVIRNKFRITDYCLLHTDYKTWHVKDDSEVVAWRYKVEPYIG